MPWRVLLSFHKQRRAMFRQEERTELYLLNVIRGLAGDETNTSKKGREEEIAHDTTGTGLCEVKRQAGMEASCGRRRADFAK